MQEYAVHLTDREFRLFQLIRQMGNTKERKENLIETVIRQIKTFSETEKCKEKKKWLLTGDKSFFQSVRPVRPEKDSPLASDIVIEQRKHLTENYE